MFKELKTTFKIGLSLRKLKNADDIEKDKAMDFVLSTLSSEQGIFTKFSQYLGSNKLPLFARIKDGIAEPEAFGSSICANRKSKHISSNHY